MPGRLRRRAGGPVRSIEGRNCWSWNGDTSVDPATQNWVGEPSTGHCTKPGSAGGLNGSSWKQCAKPVGREISAAASATSLGR